MDKKLHENLERELNDLMIEGELEKLRELIVDEDSIYKEQLNLMVDILDTLKKITNATGSKLIRLKDSAEEVRNLTVQDILMDLTEKIVEAIVVMGMPKDVLEESITDYGVPAKVLAAQLAIRILSRFSNYTEEGRE